MVSGIDKNIRFIISIMMFNRRIMVLKMSGGGNGLNSYTNAGILFPKLSQTIQCFSDVL